jgi:Carboxypeptidase regulatory-like domain
VQGAYGADRPERIGRPIVLDEDQHLENLRVPIFAGAVIAGTVRSSDNQPMARATIVAVRTRYLEGGVATNRAETRVNTDDRGRYRLFGLPPGDYAIAAQPVPRVASASSLFTVPAPTYFPSADKADNATKIHLDTGDERLDVDVRLLALPARAIRVQVRAADGADLAGEDVQFSVSRRDDVNFLVGMPQRVASGEVPDLAQGQYVVSASATSAASGIRRIGTATVDVAGSGPPQEVIVTVSAANAITVSGTADLRSILTPPRLNAGSIRVSLIPADGNTNPSRSGPPDVREGRFSFPRVPPGRYRLDARGIVAGGALSLWTLRSVSLDGQPKITTYIDVADKDMGSLELVLLDDLATLSGSLIPPGGRPVPPHFIVLVPTTIDASGRRQAYYTRPAADGSYLIMGVLDGAYALAVVEDVPPDDLNNPAALERLRGVAAMTLTFERGENKRQDLAISGYPLPTAPANQPHGAARAGGRRVVRRQW